LGAEHSEEGGGGAAAFEGIARVFDEGGEFFEGFFAAGVDEFLFAVGDVGGDLVGGGPGGEVEFVRKCRVLSAECRVFGVGAVDGLDGDEFVG